MRSSVADCRSATSSASSPSRRIALVTRRSGPRKIQSPRPPLPPATNARNVRPALLFDIGLEAKVDPRQLLDPPGSESLEVEVVVEQLRWAVRHRRARRGEQDSLAVDGRGEIPEAEVVDRAQVVDPLGHGERDDAGGKRRRDHEPASGDRQAARRDEDVEGRLGGSQVPAEEACGRGHQREEEDGNGEPERERDRDPGRAADQRRQTHENEREQHERADVPPGVRAWSASSGTERPAVVRSRPLSKLTS